MRVPLAEQTAQQGEDLAQLHFSKLGFTVRPQNNRDYGLDHHAELIEDEQASGRLLALQVKTGDSYFAEQDGTDIIFRTDSDHMDYWLNHSLPVVVCLCDLAESEVYWQIVSPETFVSTGKGFKIRVPIDQKVDEQSKYDLQQILTPAVPGSRYTVLSENDVSFAKIKRVSVEAMVNGTATKAEIAAIVRRLTSDRTFTGYTRDELADNTSDLGVQVVWIYIYLTAEDHANSNPYCSSLWVHDELPNQLRPLPLDGENIGHDITVRWNSAYAAISRLMDSTLTKAQYLSHVTPVIDELETLTASLGARLDGFAQGAITEGKFLSATADERVRICQIELGLREMPPPPFECSGIDSLLQAAVAYLGNTSLIYSETGMSKRTSDARMRLAWEQIRSANDTLPGLRYELSKVR